MGEVVSIIDKQQEQLARDWLRAFREGGPEALQKAIEQREAQRANLSTTQEGPKP